MTNPFHRNDYRCALCSKGGMTESEAVAHECGVEPPEPDLADMPMTTREAVTVLANQMANLVDELRKCRVAFEGLTTAHQQYLSNEFPLLYPKPEPTEPPDTSWVKVEKD